MFKKILLLLNLKQKQVAQEINCSEALVSKWCRGLCEPSLNAIIKMSEAFNISIEEIVLAFKKEQEDAKDH